MVLSSLGCLKGTCPDAHAVGFLFAHFQHFLVDITDHSPGLGGGGLSLCVVVAGDVLPRWRLHGPGLPPLLALLLVTNVVQETEGNVACKEQQNGRHSGYRLLDAP